MNAMVQTHLHIRLHSGQRATALAHIRTRRVFEECADAIGGFLGAELLVAPHDPELVCIVAHWRDRQAAEAWLASPVRAAQARDLAGFAAAPPQGHLFEPTGYAWKLPASERPEIPLKNHR